MATNMKPVYKRILLKLNGEVLQGIGGFGTDASILDRMAQEIKELAELGIQVGVVTSGGNLFHGAGLAKADMSRVAGDHMGILVTVMSDLAARDVLHRAYMNVHLMSVTPLNGVCDSYSWVEAISLLRNNRVVILFTGTGSPFFTIDSAACLCGVEIEADVALKATRVNGVLTADLAKDPTTTMYEQLTYSGVLKKELKAMDLVTFALACDYKLPIRVPNMNKPGALRCAVTGEEKGTLVAGQFPWWIDKGKIPRKYREGSYP